MLEPAEVNPRVGTVHVVQSDEIASLHQGSTEQLIVPVINNIERYRQTEIFWKFRGIRSIREEGGANEQFIDVRPEVRIMQAGHQDVLKKGLRNVALRR